LWINSIQYILNNTSYNKGIIKDKNNPWFYIKNNKSKF
jgi:hypothetical protein